MLVYSIDVSVASGCVAILVYGCFGLIGFRFVFGFCWFLGFGLCVDLTL